MKKEDFENKMLDLVEGKLSPEQWDNWWNEHQESISQLLTAGEYLRIKPSPHGFRWVPILTSQKGAVGYLTKNNIPFERSAVYQQNYEKELNDYCQQQDALIKEKLNSLKITYPVLFEKYPRFCNSLEKAFSVGDKIENGIDDISCTNFALPADIKDFFKVVSVIKLDGISIDYGELRTEHFCKREYLVLGEFWKDADGDLLLIDLAKQLLPTPIYYYCHSLNKVKKLCNSIDELIENKFSYYNRR